MIFEPNKEFMENLSLHLSETRMSILILFKKTLRGHDGGDNENFNKAIG